jgi:YbgC/YbaW family acyl-CoA thioester hydrolase
MDKPKAFHHPYTIAMRDTDAAGVLFCGSLIPICHTSYEAMLASCGLKLGSLLKHAPFGLPLVHIEGDFQKPLRVSDEVDVVVRISEIGRTSFTVKYELRNAAGDTHATASTVHVCVERDNYQSKDIPDDLRAVLSRYLGV